MRFGKSAFWSSRSWGLLLLVVLVAACGSDSELRVVIDGDDDVVRAIDTAAIFIADKEVNEKFELFAVDAKGDAVIKLSGALDQRDDVTTLAVSPDKTLVAFGVEQIRIEGTFHQLFIARTDGSELFPIGELEVAVNFHHRYAWAPDSGRIAFVAPDGVFTALPDGKDIRFVAEAGNFLSWSPAGDRLAFRVGSDLFTAFPDGTGLIRVGNNIPGVLTPNFKWAPNAARIAFAAAVSTVDDDLGLFTVFPDGTDLIRIGGPVNTIPLGLGGLFNPLTVFEWAPDSEFIAFVGGEPPPDVPSDEAILLSARPRMVAGDLEIAAGIRFSQFDAFEWSPLGDRIAFLADENRDNLFQLFTASPLGSERLLLTGPLVFDGPLDSYAWSPPKGDHLAFIAALDFGKPLQLFVSLFEGGQTINLTGFLDESHRVETFFWSPTGAMLAFAAENPDGVFLLYGAPADGGEIYLISRGIVDPAAEFFTRDLFYFEINAFEFSADGSRLYFIADPDTNGRFRLFSALPEGAGITDLTGTLAAEGDVVQFAIIH